MRFEELERRAGQVAVEVGRRAERLPFSRIRRSHERRMAIAGWSGAVAAIVLVIGLASFWPGANQDVPLAASPTATPTSADDGEMPGVVVGDREACPVTKPGDRPFAPAGDAPGEPSPVYEATWYGTPDLWTMLELNGQVWEDLPVGADGSLTQKTFWWSDDYVFSEELRPDISVTAEHLNGSSATVNAGSPGTNASHPDLGNFMIVGLEIPEEGCWRITAEYRDTALSYVAWVGNVPTGDAQDDQP